MHNESDEYVDLMVGDEIFEEIVACDPTHGEPSVHDVEESVECGR
jgi:hypothetical protein